jgi:hypothetical protein
VSHKAITLRSRAQLETIHEGSWRSLGVLGQVTGGKLESMIWNGRWKLRVGDDGDKPHKVFGA